MLPRGAWVGLISFVLFCAAIVLIASSPSAGHPILSLFVFSLAGSVVGAAIGLIMLLRAWLDRPARRRWLALALVGLLWVSAVPLLHVYWPLRKWALGRLAERSEPLVQAIKRYAAEKGSPPAELAALVPEYLPVVPPRFNYWLVDSGDLVYWDLGSRQGAEVAGLVVYALGDPSHAALVLRLDAHGNIAEARSEWMPAVVDEPFDATRWRDHADARMRMVRDFAKRHIEVGAPISTLEPLIGPPTGRSVLSRGPWKLSIDFPHGLDIDRFYYSPSQQYPSSDERIGSWAYHHD